jgi:hypothetical protein
LVSIFYYFNLNSRLYSPNESCSYNIIDISRMVHFLKKWVLDHILKFCLVEILVICNILAVFNIFLTLLGVENRLINEVNKAYIAFRTKYHCVYLINTNSITFYDKFGLFLYNEFHQINHFIKILNGFLKY